jgi:V8-like Glu-specific endopeptidase
MEQQQPPIKNKAEHYRRKFGKVRESMFESASAEPPVPVFEESEVIERLGYSREGLNSFIEKYLDGDEELKKLADEVIKKGADPLRAVANNDQEYLDKSENTDFLEVLVKTDGSRPSFLIANGAIDLNSSPIGDWKDTLDQSDAKLRQALDCVGRINIDLRHIGTGWLIHRNLIITNRHVLQAIAIQNPDNSWTFTPGAHIDFGYEFKARASINPRSMVKLIFCGPKKIESPIDHTKLDLALIEIEPVPDDMVPKQIFSWDESGTWAMEDTTIYTIGYPGKPPVQQIVKDSQRIFDLLFGKTYGYKHLAPGKVISGPRNKDDLRLMHDATTLGGNSGSVILADSTETIASGLHYGGDTEEPRENWGHFLGNVLGIRNDDFNKTLRECLEEYKVQIIKSDG